MIAGVFCDASVSGRQLGASVESVSRAVTNRSLGALLFSLLALVSLAVIALTGCAGLRLPDQPPEPPNPVNSIDTPTMAPLLLTPAPTRTPLPTLPPSEASPTATFALPLPDPTCEATPMWGLGDVWKNESVRTRLGCMLSEQIAIEGEELYFEGGHLLWRPDAGLIYVLFECPWEPECWGGFADTYQPSDPDSDPTIVEPTPMSGPGGDIYGQPLGRFGKLWRENAWLRETLGWAQVSYDEDGQVRPSIPFSGVVQDFERGLLLWNGDVCYVLRTDDMSWDMY
jgi:hypothetical protein